MNEKNLSGAGTWINFFKRYGEPPATLYTHYIDEEHRRFMARERMSTIVEDLIIFYSTLDVDEAADKIYRLLAARRELSK